MKQETLKIAEITIHEQPRQDFSRVDEISESIKKIGQLQPVLVTKRKNEVVLVDGEQRIRALKKIGRSEVAVCFVDVENETAFKEAQMMANLMRTDLSFIERARGFLMLLQDAPAKYNESVIANKFGLKQKQVKYMTNLAKKIDPKIDSVIGSGRFDQDDFDDLASIPKEFQKKVVSVPNAGGNVRGIIYQMTSELHFDQVFGKAQAEAAGKVHFEDTDGEVRTFDKNYAAQVKKEFEARTKKNYEAEMAKVRSRHNRQQELTVEQRRQERDKKKSESAAAAKALKENSQALLESEPSESEIVRILEQKVWRDLRSDSMRQLIKAYGIDVKVSEFNSEQLRNLVMKKIFFNVKTTAQLVATISLIDCCDYGNDMKSWAKKINSLLKK